jgi:hypothetical protein
MLNAKAQIDTNYIDKKIAVSYKWSETPIVIDGQGVDAAWEQNTDNRYTCNKVSKYGFRDGEYDLSAQWQAVWNDTGMFFLVQVVDDILNRFVDHPEGAFYNSDNIEVYFNPTGSRTNDLINNYRLTKSSFMAILPGNEYNGYKMPCVFQGEPLNMDVINGNMAFRYSDQGYTAEFFIPFDLIVPDNATGIVKRWGFDINIGDLDESDYREAVVFWNDSCDQQWTNVNAMGVLHLNDDTEPVPGEIIIQNPELCNFKPQATITYFGNTSSQMTFEWDFDEPISVTGNNPYLVQWNDFTKREIKVVVHEQENDDTLHANIEILPIIVTWGTFKVGPTLDFKFLENCLSTFNEWDFDGAQVSYFQDIYSASWDSPGWKNIRVIARKTPVIDTFYTSVFIVEPDPTVDFYLTYEILEYTCDKATIIVRPVITSGTPPFQYSWNDQKGDSTYTIAIHDFDNTAVTLAITDGNGQWNINSVNILLHQLYSEQIGAITVDVQTGKIKILWEKTPSSGIKEYWIFKETSASGEFFPIDTVSIDQEGIVVDENSNPAKHVERYKIVTVDTCGNEMGTSEIHQSMHASINGLPGTYTITWSPYIGFSYHTYYIYKGSAANNLLLYDSISSAYEQYTDTATRNAYYQIAVQNKALCPGSMPDVADESLCRSFSNPVNTVSAGINTPQENSEITIAVFPNPFHNELVVKYASAGPTMVHIEIYDYLGVKVFDYKNRVHTSGNFNHLISGKDLAKPCGLYFVKVSMDDFYSVTKIIRE